MASRRDAARSGQGGFTFLGLLFLIMVMGILASAATTTWSFASQRDKELDLLFVGSEYRSAIARYAAAHAREPQPYPTELAQLLGGQEGAGVHRYLRRLYVDPMTGRPDWGLVRTSAGGITGVYSLSPRQPIRTAPPAGFGQGIDLLHARSYADWVFGVAEGAPADATLPPGWNPTEDGAPPLRWDAAHPKPPPGDG